MRGGHLPAHDARGGAAWAPAHRGRTSASAWSRGTCLAACRAGHAQARRGTAAGHAPSASLDSNSHRPTRYLKSPKKKTTQVRVAMVAAQFADTGLHARKRADPMRLRGGAEAAHVNTLARGGGGGVGAGAHACAVPQHLPAPQALGPAPALVRIPGPLVGLLPAPPLRADARRLQAPSPSHHGRLAGEGTITCMSSNAHYT